MALLKNWHLMRILRVVVGIWAVVEAFRTHQAILSVFGAWIAIQGIFNIGCCGVPQQYQNDATSNEDAENITFEEVK